MCEVRNRFFTASRLRLSQTAAAQITNAHQVSVGLHGILYFCMEY